MRWARVAEGADRQVADGAIRLCLRLWGRGCRADVKPAPSGTSRRTVTGETRVLDRADTTGRQPGLPKQKQCRLEPTGQSILMRLSSWPALHMCDPDNTFVDRNRLERISERANFVCAADHSLGSGRDNEIFLTQIPTQGAIVRGVR
jgi:hypothetical protein